MFQKKSQEQPSDDNSPQNNSLPGSLGGFRSQNLRDFEGASKFDSSVVFRQARLRIREEAGEVLQDHDYKIRVLLTCKAGVSVDDLNAITGFEAASELAGNIFSATLDLRHLEDIGKADEVTRVDGPKRMRMH